MNRDIAWVIFFLLLLGVAWSAQNRSSGLIGGGGINLEPSGSSSGPSSYSSFQNNKTTSYSSAPSQDTNNTEQQEKPKWEGTVNISYARAKESSPQKEYIELRASSLAKEPIPISGWYLANRDGTKVQIPKGTNLVYSARVNTKEIIYLNPGDKALILTGESPIGANFRLNICTGYFEQFQDFAPSLPKHCPYPRTELEDSPLNLEDECYNYVKTLPRCETPLKNFALDISNDCREFLNEELTYAGCVEKYKNDNNFFEKEWRVYLGRNAELWSNSRGKIQLFDNEGNLVKEVSY